MSIKPPSPPSDQTSHARPAVDAGAAAGGATTPVVREHASAHPRSTWKPGPPQTTLQKSAHTLKWLPAFAWQRITRRPVTTQPVHLVMAVADHYEPGFLPKFHNLPTSEAEQEARVDEWCRDFRRTADDLRDVDGRPFVHSYFHPAEEFYPAVVERLVELSHEGFGEVEIQLHHGVWEADTAENTRRTIEEFRDRLVAFGALSRWHGRGPARFGFVHGNWALANSNHGRYCGVDNEMQVLADAGCFADFTLPSAPSEAQVTKINSIYECALPLTERAPHRRGRDLTVGRPPRRWPLIVQGPLGLELTSAGATRPRMRIETGELHGSRPLTLGRVDFWRRAAITVRGRPDWVFIKLHCHGLGAATQDGQRGRERLQYLETIHEYARQRGDSVHFVSAREMVNIALAACDGREGNPGDYRDYRLQLITPRR